MPQVIPIFTRAALEGRGFDIGEYSYGVPTVRWWGEKASLKIGRFCSISDGVEIFLGGNHRSDWITTYPFSAIAHWPEAESIYGHPSTRGDVIIGNDVWIASHAMIHSGVKIGDGAVIGAGSVVRRDVPPYALVAGNPAEAVRLRFSEREIATLLKIRWWDWEEGRIRDTLPLLLSGNISLFFDACGFPNEHDT
ncbi:CatB-related O-acetyltransferase [Mesorhizobium sp. LNHC209A00]|uniref:CatB-related O-acetyltransferase n=1 Tax=Mesorhizobium TaxID=68287 RepID=UPI0018DD9B4A|nr:CatB-related O-acetyltransferase [Mesorhizobium sp. LNHC209A00]